MRAMNPKALSVRARAGKLVWMTKPAVEALGFLPPSSSGTSMSLHGVYLPDDHTRVWKRRDIA